MKRAKELRPLSRQHHGALLVAKALIEAERVEAARSAYLDFWEPAGRLHFQIEEGILLPAWMQADKSNRSLAVRLLEEHLDLRTRAWSLEHDTKLGLEAVHELGARLRNHVRFEERQVFPEVEAALSPSALAQLGAAIAGSL